MKKVLKSIIITVLIIIIIASHSESVHASSFSAYASTDKTTPNKTISITVSLDGEGLFEFSASNAKLSTNREWINQSCTIKATVGSAGTATISVTAVDAAGYDENPITGTKTLKITINEVKEETPVQQKPSVTQENRPTVNQQKPQTDTSNTVQEEIKPLSSDNSLKTISLSSGKLDPVFNSDITSYKVILPPETTSIELSAQPNNSSASISGTGKIELKTGKQEKKIICKAENGSIKEYIITFIVEEKIDTFIPYEEESLGVVTYIEDIKVPEGFKEHLIQIYNKEIKAYKHEKSQVEIVYLKDSSGEGKFYRYDKGNVISLYETLTINDKEYIIAEPSEEKKIGLIYTDITINNQTLKGYSFKDKNYSDYYLITLINESGEECLYMYETTEGTLQKYVSMTPYFMYGLSAIAVLSFISVLFFILYIKNKRKLSQLKHKKTLSENNDDHNIQWPTYNDIQ